MNALATQVGGYVPEVAAVAERLAVHLKKIPIKFPRWISTPEGDEGNEWCSDCGYYKVRNLRRHDRKRRDDYLLDGGWRTEEEHFCHCVACGVRLDVCLTDYGLEDAIRMFEECGFSTSPEQDAYEINEMLGCVEYAYNDNDEAAERRRAVLAIAEQFLANASVPS